MVVWWCQHPARELVLFGVSQDCGDVVVWWCGAVFVVVFFVVVFLWWW